MTPILNTKPGSIIILNGTSSVGKSTLASAIAREFNDSLIVRCDDVAVRVFHRLIAEYGYKISEDAPKDLMSLCYMFPEINKVLDDEVNVDMYREIRLNADLGKTVINDTAWVGEKDVEDFNRELSGYNVLRIFVHSSLDDMLVKVMKRNLNPDVIEHRHITLPFKALPLMYKAQNYQDENTLEIWHKDEIVFFMNKLQADFESVKPTYHDTWQQEGDSFFSKIDELYNHFQFDVRSSVPIAPLNPFDYVVNTSKLTLEECAKKIAFLLQNGSTKSFEISYMKKEEVLSA